MWRDQTSAVNGHETNPRSHQDEGEHALSFHPFASEEMFRVASVLRNEAKVSKFQRLHRSEVVQVSSPVGLLRELWFSLSYTTTNCSPSQAHTRKKYALVNVLFLSIFVLFATAGCVSTALQWPKQQAQVSVSARILSATLLRQTIPHMESEVASARWLPCAQMIVPLVP